VSTTLSTTPGPSCTRLDELPMARMDHSRHDMSPISDVAQDDLEHGPKPGTTRSGSNAATGVRRQQVGAVWKSSFRSRPVIAGSALTHRVARARAVDHRGRIARDRITADYFHLSFISGTLLAATHGNFRQRPSGAEFPS